ALVRHRPPGSGSCSTLGTIVSQKARTAARWLSSSWKVIARLSSRSVQRIIAATRPSYKAGLEILYGGRMTGGPRGLILGDDWAVGFALAFGGAGWFAGTHGTFVNTANGALFPAISGSDATVGSKWFFEFVFCAVSLAIVWGTTLERIKFGAYLIYAVIFSTLIYPIVSHWIFGGGWLAHNIGMQDFAGSTVVHLIGATGAFAALLLLGPRQGKYGR